MEDIQTPCALHHIEAVTSGTEWWAVNSEGTAIALETSAPSYGETIEYYVCQNCDEEFVPSAPPASAAYWPALEAVWREVREHLAAMREAVAV